jgi:surfeit locus 1 family protein
MKTHFLKLRFWILLIVTLLGCSLTASLGFWQLRRAETKETLQANIADQQSLAVLQNTDLLSLSVRDVGSNALHREARLRGVWLAEATIYLDNRPMGKKSGFYVLTPLRLENDGRLLLVQRGWVARNFQDRSLVTEVPTPNGIVEVHGRIAHPPSKIYDLGDAGTGRIRQNVDIASLSQALDAEVFHASLVQLSPPLVDDGLLRHWPVIGSDVHKHYGYAVQWFALCILMVILYVWFQLISPRRRVSASRGNSTE